MNGVAGQVPFCTEESPVTGDAVPLAAGQVPTELHGNSAVRLCDTGLRSDNSDTSRVFPPCWGRPGLYAHHLLGAAGSSDLNGTCCLVYRQGN